jgi:hypothetical protein
MLKRFNWQYALSVVVLTALAGALLMRPTVDAQSGAGVAAYNLCVTVTPSDTVDLPPFTASRMLTGLIYVGGTGNAAVVASDGTVTLLSAIPVGAQLPLSMRRINATNTTATLITACYRQ